MTKNNARNNLYKKCADIRDTLFRPLAIIFTFLHISPPMLTYSGIIAMVLFVAYAKENINISLWLLIFAIFADMVDGVTARYQKTDSDRGKFTDVLADNISFTLFVAGLAFAKLISPMAALLFVYFMVISKVFRMIIHSFEFKSDWYFRAVAGFVPNLLAAISFILFFIFIIFDINIMTNGFYLFSTILIVDSIIFYFRIIDSQTQK